MPEADVIAMLKQFGTAGLLAWLWLSERRSSAAREQQLTEAHAKVMGQGQQIDVLTKALNDSTRALTLLEAGQRELIRVLERLDPPDSPRPRIARADGQPRRSKAGGGGAAA